MLFRSGCIQMSSPYVSPNFSTSSVSRNDESPTTARAKRLQDRLLGLESALEDEKMDRQRMVESKFRALDDRISATQAASDVKYKL